LNIMLFVVLLNLNKKKSYNETFPIFLFQNPQEQIIINVKN